MAEIVRVKGSLDSLQANLDFYLQITSTGYMRVEDLRKEFFREFMKEEKSRMLDIRGYKGNSDDESDNDAVEDKYCVVEDVCDGSIGEYNNDVSKGTCGGDYEGTGNGEAFEDDEVQNGSLTFMQMVQAKKLESCSVESEGTDETEKSHIEEDYDVYSVEDTKSDEVTTQNDDEGYVTHGVYLEDYEYLPEEGGEKSDSDNYIQNDVYQEHHEDGTYNDDVEYTTHGVYLEDCEYLSEEDKGETGVDNSDQDVYQGKYEDGQYGSEDADESNDDEEDYETEGYDYPEDSESSDNTDEDGQDDGLFEDPFEENIQQEGMFEERRISEDGEGCDDGFEIDELFEGGFCGSQEHEEQNGQDEDDIDWLDEGIDRVDDVQESLFDNSFVDDQKKEEKVEVPSDIRKFLREHPMSTVDFVLQYYSKKEVDKALALGRIYKKKGKLMI